MDVVRHEHGAPRLEVREHDGDAEESHADPAQRHAAVGGQATGGKVFAEGRAQGACVDRHRPGQRYPPARIAGATTAGRRSVRDRVTNLLVVAADGSFAQPDKVRILRLPPPRGDCASPSARHEDTAPNDPMRHPLFLLLLCACSTMSTEERSALVSHQRNAKHYFEGGHLNQAMGQIERGLELDPDDYLLNSLKGAVLLKTSADSQGTDHRRLDEATALLARMFDERAPNRHEPHLLFNYALALQKQGRRHLGEAIRLEGQATRTPQQQDLLKKAATERTTAMADLTQARSLLAVLIERGEVLLLAHKHQMLIAQDLGEDAPLVEAGGAYLLQSEKEQKKAQKDVETTPTAAWEAERLAALRALWAEELEVRALLADHHYGKQQYTEALPHLNRILNLDPQRSVDYYNRGRVLLALKQPEPAKADFRKFLATTTLPATSDKKTLALKALDQ